MKTVTFHRTHSANNFNRPRNGVICGASVYWSVSRTPERVTCLRCHAVLKSRAERIRKADAKWGRSDA